MKIKVRAHGLLMVRRLDSQMGWLQNAPSKIAQQVSEKKEL